MFTKDSRFVWISSEKHCWELVVIRTCFNFFRMVFRKLWINASTINGASLFLCRKNDEKRPVPLRNIGLNCYLNSSFQSIVACNKFVDEMRNLEVEYPRSRNLQVFNKILHSLCENTSDDVELSTNSILRNWNRSGEQDTFELLSYIIFQVFNELRTFQQNKKPFEERTAQNWIKEPLPLKLLIEFRIKCNCGYSFTPTLQSDLALHLSVPFRIYSNTIPFTIERLLDNYFIPENISDFPCLNASCTNSHVTKFIVLQKPMPNTLCLHIQRSFWNGKSNRMEKNNEKLSFQEKLTLKKEFFTEYHPCLDGPLSSVCLDICKSENLFFNKIETEVITGSHKEVEKENIVDGDKIHNCNLQTTNKEDSINNTQFSACLNIKTNEELHSSKLVLTEMTSKCPDDEKVNKIYQNLSLPCENEVNLFSNNTLCQSNINGDESVGDYQSETVTPRIYVVNNSNIESDLLPIDESVKPLDYIKERMEQKLTNHIDKDYENEEYYLKSVIVHFGRAETGHYICYRKCGAKWFCTNDNFITEVSFNEVRNSQAYILMYERTH